MIEVRDLSVTFGRARVLDRVSFDVGDGEAVALVGSNGAGKTTVFRAALGLVRHEGTLRIAGIDAARDPIGAKSRIGYMPQVPASCEETALGALRFVAALRDVPVSAVEPLLVRVGLGGHKKQPVRTFSTGMRQRLSLAAALLGDPPVLFMDEPTASLDLSGQGDFIALIRGLKKAGKTIVLSSHRAEEVRALADRIVVLDAGRVIAVGPVDEVAPSVWNTRPLALRVAI